jgi:hypothetical protein
MLSILRLFPKHLVLNTLKPLVGCRYISKIRNKTPLYFKKHEEHCQRIKDALPILVSLKVKR